MKSSPVGFLMMYEADSLVKQFSFIAGRMTFALRGASWRSTDLRVQGAEPQKQVPSAKHRSGAHGLRLRNPDVKSCMNILDGSHRVEPGLSALGLGSDTLFSHTLPLSRYEVCEDTEEQESGADCWVNSFNRSDPC